jgi:ABC-type Fe3+ transport system permease subunit
LIYPVLAPSYSVEFNTSIENSQEQKLHTPYSENILNDIKQQLAPGWSTVNIVILVALFTFSMWPIALLFLAYILWGAKVGLDLSQPETIKAFGRRLTNAFRAGIDAFSKG